MCGLVLSTVSDSILASWCIVETRITFLCFFGMYDTIVVVGLKPNILVRSDLSRTFANCGGSSRLFFSDGSDKCQLMVVEESFSHMAAEHQRTFLLS